VTQDVFEDFRQFNEGVCRVRADGKWGVIDANGITQIGFEFDYITRFIDGLALAHRGDQHGVIDRTGAWQLVLDGWIVDALEARVLSRNAVLVFKPGVESDHEPCGWDGALYGVVDLDGREIIPPSLTGRDLGQFGPYRVHEGMMMVLGRDAKYGFIRVDDGELVGKPEYEHAMAFSDGMAAVEKDGKWGFIDRSGKLVIPCRYDSIHTYGEGSGLSGFRNGLALVQMDGIPRYIDRNGRTIWIARD
jgi:hypothetical protein